MAFSSRNIPLVFHMIFLMTGIAGNLFILIVHFLDWLKTRKFNSCDFIINCIVIFNILLQGIVAFDQICMLLFVEFFLQVQIVNSVIVLMSSLSFSSLWCSTCLCFYYCVKIINSNGPCFYKLKANLERMVPWLIFVSIALAWASGLPAYWDLYLYFDFTFSTFNMTRNITAIHLKLKSRCNCFFQMYMLLSAVAISIISITAGAIITSLCKHMNRIKKNNEGSRTGKISSHVTAARTVTSLLLFFLFFYVAVNIIYNTAQDTESVIFIASFLVCSSFPTVNAIILISGNKKLSNMGRKLLGVTSAAGNTEVTVTT